MTRPLTARPIRRSAPAVVLIAILWFFGYVGYLQLSGNVHPVVAGQVYRSAQPSPDSIAEWQRRYGIRTILNLRGANPGRPWYDAEIAASARLGIAHLDFRMSASRDLPREQVDRLLAMLRGADRPLLIHCRAGADRSGLAAALYVAAIAQQGEDAAERQLSIWYGHLGVPYLSSAYQMDRTWEKLEPGLGFSPS